MSLNNKYTIKNINGKQYLYTWSYRKKHLRTKNKNQRYAWKYIGPLYSAKVKRYISKMPSVDQERISKQTLHNEERVKKEQEKIMELKNQEPFLSRIEEIMKIANRHKRDTLIRAIENELKAKI